MNTRTIGLLLIVMTVMVAGCGYYSDVALEELGAERVEDDFVEVTAKLRCELVGHPDCGEVSPYCVAADWYPADALDGEIDFESVEPGEEFDVEIDGASSFEGDPLASAETCHEDVLEEDEVDTLIVRSDEPLATDEEIVIHVTMTTENEGTTYGDRVLRSP